jgi:hypothetical protein
MTVAVDDDSHNHIIANVDGLQTALDAKAPLASPTFTGTVTTPSLTLGGTAVTAIATQAQAQAGTVNTVLMTPLSVAQAIDAQVPAPTAAQVGAATADLTSGAVGTYAILLANSDSFEFNRNTNYAGSNFSYMHFNMLDGGPALRGYRLTVPSGTWKALAGSTNGGDRNTNGALFLRVS